MAGLYIPSWYLLGTFCFLSRIGFPFSKDLWAFSIFCPKRSKDSPFLTFSMWQLSSLLIFWPAAAYKLFDYSVLLKLSCSCIPKYIVKVLKWDSTPIIWAFIDGSVTSSIDSSHSFCSTTWLLITNLKDGALTVHLWDTAYKNQSCLELIHF